MYDTPCQSTENATQPVYMRQHSTDKNSIASLLVRTESRRQRRRRKRGHVERERSESSSEEETVTCISFGGSYNSKADVVKCSKQLPKYVIVKNKNTQTEDKNCGKACKGTQQEVDLKTVGNSAFKIPERNIFQGASDFRRAGLIDKENFASPLTGHLYGINIPQLSIPGAALPEMKMFDFIEENQIGTLNFLVNDTDVEHRNLLTAVADAILDSKNPPSLSCCYDATLNDCKRNMSRIPKFRFDATKAFNESAFNICTKKASKRKLPPKYSSAGDSDLTITSILPARSWKKMRSETEVPSSFDASESKVDEEVTRVSTKITAVSDCSSGYSVLKSSPCGVLPVISEGNATCGLTLSHSTNPFSEEFVIEKSDKCLETVADQNACAAQTNCTNETYKNLNGKEPMSLSVTKFSERKSNIPVLARKILL